MDSYEKKLKDQAIDVKTICFGERTARKLWLERKDTQLIREIEKQEVVSLPILLEELGKVAQQIQRDIEKRTELIEVKHSDYPIADHARRSFWKGYIEAKEEDLGLLVEEEGEK